MLGVVCDLLFCDWIFLSELVLVLGFVSCFLGLVLVF